MAEIFEPFDGGPYMYESGWSTLFALALSNGIASRSSNGLDVYSDNDGRQVKIRAGIAHIRGHLYQSTNVQIKQLDPNPSGNPRIDRVVLRLDTAGKNIHPLILKGEPSGSPLLPGILQVPGGIWDLPLANVPIPAGFGSIVDSTIIDQRSYAGARTADNVVDSYVGVSEMTPSSTYTDLTTYGPEVIIDVPASGKILLTLSAAMLPAAAPGYATMTFSASGASSIAPAASDRFLSIGNSGAVNMMASNSFLLTNLNPGITTFTAKYRQDFTTSATFGARRLTVQVLP